jgi:hypothetical protein
MADDPGRESNWHAARVVVDVGAKVRLSVALLREMYDRPLHLTQVVEVERLIRESDGTITIWLAQLNSMRQ